jgi:hypothetical protein
MANPTVPVANSHRLRQWTREDTRSVALVITFLLMYGLTAARPETRHYGPLLLVGGFIALVVRFGRLSGKHSKGWNLDEFGPIVMAFAVLIWALGRISAWSAAQSWEQQDHIDDLLGIPGSLTASMQRQDYQRIPPGYSPPPRVLPDDLKEFGNFSNPMDGKLLRDVGIRHLGGEPGLYSGSWQRGA